MGAIVEPRNQPITGMRNWNKPKWKERRKRERASETAPEELAPMDTANASRDNPTAISRISTMLNFSPVFFQKCPVNINIPAGDSITASGFRSASAGLFRLFLRYDMQYIAGSEPLNSSSEHP